MKRLLSLILVMILFAACDVIAEETSWICLRDGTENSGKYCGECGTSKQDATVWTCPVCGKEKLESAFCPDCGTKCPVVPPHTSLTYENTEFNSSREAAQAYNEADNAGDAQEAVSAFADEAFTEPDKEKRSYSVDSRISGEKITSEDGKTVGTYTVRYKSVDSEDAKTIPVPDPEVRLPGEYTYYDIQTTDDGVYYAYITASRESNAEKYWNLLADEGFTCRADLHPGSISYYYASKDGYAEIRVKDNSTMVKDGRSCILIFIPNAYSIERENSVLSDHFSVRSSCGTETLHGVSIITNDKFVVRNFTGDAQEGTLVLKFNQDTYSAGDWYNLNDFLLESNKYPSSRRSCELLCESLSTEKYSTLSAPVTGRHNYEYFDALDVEFLECSPSRVVIYFYAKVTNEIETTCEVEGIIDCSKDLSNK